MIFVFLSQSLMIYYPQKESDPIELKNVFNSLLLIVEIFYDLNAQVISKLSIVFFSSFFSM